MILYFTGTGNSAYVAEHIGKIIDDEVVNLFDKLKSNDFSDVYSQKPFVIVTPTFCWQIPHIVRDWLIRTKLVGNIKIYFVMTCGGEVGNAEKYLKELCQGINMHYMGCGDILMPENYLAMFDTPSDDEAAKIIENAGAKINLVAEKIKASQKLDDIKVGVVDKVKSSIVNDLFYPLFVKDKQFYSTDACIGCGLCESKCVLKNIKMVNSRPEWQGNCTHCMACICYCPKNAIEYGKHSLGQNRYTAPIK